MGVLMRLPQNPDIEVLEGKGPQGCEIFPWFIIPSYMYL